MKNVVDGRTCWVGFDLDGTLAHYDGEWKGIEVIGEPIPKMVDFLLYTIRLGELCGFEVKIFTARASDKEAVGYVQDWLLENFGIDNLEVTNVKDHPCRGIIDDRVIRCFMNTGELDL